MKISMLSCLILIHLIHKYIECLSSVQSLSHVPLFVTPWAAAQQASLSITNSRACSYSCPSRQRCHPTISSSVIPFSSRLQSFPASERTHRISTVVIHVYIGWLLTLYIKCVYAFVSLELDN